MNHCYEERLITHDSLGAAKLRIHYLVNRDSFLWVSLEGNNAEACRC